MSTVINGGTTADPTLTVRVGLNGTGAAAGDTVQLYKGVAALGNPVAITATDISNDYKDIATPALADDAYPFNATVRNFGGASPPSVSNYTVTVAGAPPPPPGGGGGGGGGATLLFEDHFTSLDLVSNANPNGRWRPNDFWQNLNEGYKDYAGSNWNLNPNDANTQHMTPFSVASSILTISSFRTPSGIIAGIETVMNLQGDPGPGDPNDRAPGAAKCPKWCGGMLITNANIPAYQHLYGYFEFLARFPIQNRGMFPALWFYNFNGGPHPSAEIDLLEIFGTPNHWDGGVHGSTSFNVVSASEDTAGWHTYALDWQPTYLRFYRDDVLKGEVTGSNASWFNTPMAIRLNYAMDAFWFAAQNHSDANTPTLTMEIDYVRVYDSKP